MMRASAPGKAILLGEHAVVYGQPALAVPVTQLQATAALTPGGAEFWIEAPNVGRRYPLREAAPDDVLAAAVRLTCARAGVTDPAPATLTLDSTIPLAAGLGSGAAACTAVVRVLAEFLKMPLAEAEVSALVFETEKLLHGTPSGIDNTVVTFARPVYFVKGQPPVPLTVGAPFHLLIGDTGVASPTKAAVADVRAAWQNEPERYDRLFAEIGALANEARQIIEDRHGGRLSALGELMNRDHDLLRALGVSSPELERLVPAARAAGALGAKLSGGGRGGNMLALVTPETEPVVRAALERAGARRVIGTTISP
jgi:mevalonate kinase